VGGLGLSFGYRHRGKLRDRNPRLEQRPPKETWHLRMHAKWQNKGLMFAHWNLEHFPSYTLQQLPFPQAPPLSQCDIVTFAVRDTCAGAQCTVRFEHLTATMKFRNAPRTPYQTLPPHLQGQGREAGRARRGKGEGYGQGSGVSRSCSPLRSPPHSVKGRLSPPIKVCRGTSHTGQDGTHSRQL